MKKLSLRRLFSLVLVLSMVMSMFTGCSSDKSKDNTNNNSTNINVGGKAGEYKASAKGYGGDVTVTVTIAEDGSIAKAEVDCPNETESIGQVAAPKICETVATNQTLAVDVVSGATLTSNATLTALEDALTQAGADIDALKNNKVTAQKGEDEEVTYDVVVAGAGGSGVASALAAAEKGHKVLVIEQNPAAGGNSMIASGFFAIGTQLLKDEGIDLSVDEAVQSLIEFNDYLANGTIIRKIVENAGSTVEWLQDYGVEFYIPETTTQLAHQDDLYKWKTYHKFVDQAAAFKSMVGALEKMGVDIRYNTSLETVRTNDKGDAIGITAKKEDGSTLTVNATSTIICTGGFGADTEKTAEILKSKDFNSLGVNNNGEGIKAITEAGGFDLDATPLLHACQFAASTVKQDSAGEELAGYSDSPLTQLLNSPLLWVDSTGSRFTNEDVVYDTAFWANAAYSVGGKYYIIVDEATLKAYSKGTKMTISQAGPGANMDKGDFVALADQAVEGKTAWKSDSLSGLADQLDMNASDLEATVARYNKMVSNGKDTDYGKDAKSLLYTVESGNYYAFDVRGVYLGTIGGVKVDDNMQVFNTDYKLINGLYAAGTTAGGYYTGLGYPPYEGLACGFAYTSGRIAGTSAAEYVESVKK